MKKGMVLNTQVSSVIADMGHFDTLSIGDAGMPVPEGTKKIDLAVQKGLPSFIDVLKNVLSELQIQNPDQLANIKKIIDVPIEFISHNDMKKRLGSNKAFIRTGEASPYSNIILESGVTF